MDNPTLPATGTDLHAFIAVAGVLRPTPKLLAAHLMRNTEFCQALLKTTEPNLNDIADNGIHDYIEGV